MYTYETYGRRIRSEVVLPLLSRGTETGARTDPDVRVRRASVPSVPGDVDGPVTRVHESPSADLTAYRDERTVYWFADGVGRLRVGDGTIAVDPVPAASDDAVGRLVVGPGFRTACRRQGDVVVHASAVLVDGQVVAFTGPGGRGKSTTAAACHAQGYDVVTDDALAIDLCEESAMVPAGPAELDVGAPARDALGLDGEEPVDGSEREDHGPWPLGRVYVLAAGEELAIEALSPRAATFALLEATDGLYGADDREARRGHLENGAAVAGATTVARLVRPQSLARLPELAGLVAADVRGDRDDSGASGRERSSE